MKNVKKDCFAYKKRRCDALTSTDCEGCRFYQNEIAYKIKLERHNKEVEECGAGISYEKE